MAGAGVLVVGGLVTLPVTMAHAATQCEVSYATNDWPGGFTASLSIKNTGEALDGWTLRFTFPNSSQQVVHGWSAWYSQFGQNVTAQNESYNGSQRGGLQRRRRTHHGAADRPTSHHLPTRKPGR